MISLTSRDGGESGLEMDEVELEEGEAHALCHNDGEDSTIDPDVALSYIEEKLHNVLGHFQKDFEGGVSAENLGAKFGGYGSFLPAYQRSPSWSRIRSPLEARNSNSPTSPRKIYTEDRRQNSIASSNVSPSSRSRNASGKAVSVGSSVRGNSNPQFGLPSTCAGESSSKRGVIKKATNSSDQKSLKVRIKVGSENLSTQKNTDIYSGLGLEISPSTSLDDSPATSTGLCSKFLQGREESPISILQTMTSFYGDPLLSPLPESLIHLTVNTSLPEKSESKLIESAGNLSNGSLSGGTHKAIEKKPLKPRERSDEITTKLSNQKNSRDDNANVAFLNIVEKESDIDTLGCDKLVTNTLKLPLLSGCHYNNADHGKGAPDQDGVKREILTTEEYLNNLSGQDNVRARKWGGRLGSTSPVTESRGVSNIAASSHKVVPKEEKSLAFEQTESDISRKRKLLESKSSAEPLKHLVVQEEKSVSEDGSKRSVDKLSIVPKRKQKTVHSPGCQDLDIPKSYSVAASSASHMHGKKSGANCLVSKNEFHDLPKGQDTPVDHYKDFFGDVNFEEDDNESVSGDTTSMGRLNDPQLVEKRSSSESHSTLEEQRDAKNPEMSCTLEKYPTVSTDLAPVFGNRQSSQAPVTVVPLVQEDWVSCDKCQKWRLLPLGTDPKSLPDKWLCRMLTWLPGMNRCNVPEVETTNALRGVYHPAVPVPGTNYESQQVQLKNFASGDVTLSGQETRTNSVQVAPISKKKKHGPTKAANSVDLDGKTHSSNSLKNSASGNNSKLNRKNCFPLEASGYQDIQQSSDPVDKYAVKDKSSLVSQSHKGTSMKVSINQVSEMEDFKPSKRIRSTDLHVEDLNWASNNGGTSSKVGHRSVSLSNDVLGHSQHKNKKDRRNNAKKDIVLSKDAGRNDPGRVNDDLSHSTKSDDGVSLRKRKSEQANGFGLHQEPISSFGQHIQESGAFVEQMHDEHRVEKKAKVSKWKAKDDTVSKVSGVANKSMNAKDQALVAANSSSSKVSGSHKDKTSDHEVKSSPVESVSSSPMRFATSGNITSVGRNLTGKDNLCGPGSPTAGENGGSGEKEIGEKVTNCFRDTQKDVLSHSNRYADAKISSQKRQDDEKPSTEQSQNSTKYQGQPSHSKDRLSKKMYPDIRVHDKNSLPPDSDSGKLPKKMNPNEVCVSEKSNSLLPPLNACHLHPVLRSHRESGDALDNVDAENVQIRGKKSEKQNDQPTTSSRDPTQSMHKSRVEAPSPLRRDSSSHAANTALKEAKDLKHLADRLKNSGSAENIGLYFQAALKFLHGASLLESGSSEATKHNELKHSLHIYSSTAKLCEFCAHEYEKSKDMACAALAYKCVEVAYMRVVYSSNTSSIRDMNELQTALKIVPPGESPSSSASDIDNLNNHGSADKAAKAKVVGSPQVSGSHILTSRNRAGLLQILNFAQDVNSAMEASRKSRTAFAAATSRLGNTSHNEGIASLKKALDFNFQDVEVLLRLVRVAMEAIAR